MKLRGYPTLAALVPLAGADITPERMSRTVLKFGDAPTVAMRPLQSCMKV